jgi:hypothetical protein
MLIHAIPSTHFFREEGEGRLRNVSEGGGRVRVWDSEFRGRSRKSCLRDHLYGNLLYMDMYVYMYIYIYIYI